uniref:Uncharacterized protein n=1 Tax=Vespula pensylvanica TaxID=30213 RepID=A0A834U9X3_VESPE|nr:hypothetical protein H0235_007792 [Vespula pensylvanica]
MNIPIRSDVYEKAGLKLQDLFSIKYSYYSDGPFYGDVKSRFALDALRNERASFSIDDDDDDDDDNDDNDDDGDDDDEGMYYTSSFSQAIALFAVLRIKFCWFALHGPFARCYT